MNIDWNILTPEILNFIMGGGLVGLITIPWVVKEKRIANKGAQLDNEGKGVDIKSRDLDNASKLIKEYQDLLAQYKEQKEQDRLQKEEDARCIRELTTKVNEMERQMTTLQNQFTNALLNERSANAKRCDVLGCPYRRPPLDKEALQSVLGMTQSEIDALSQIVESNSCKSQENQDAYE